MIGHPEIEPFSLMENFTSHFNHIKLKGFALRPFVFVPTFQKHKDQTCGGLQIHVTDRNVFEPWKVGQHLCRLLRHHLGNSFVWKSPPYEYEFSNLPFDILNGTDKLRHWVENNGTHEELVVMDETNEFSKLRSEHLLYN